MQIQDVYKLMYQAAMGSGHAVPDSEFVWAWLDRELREMGAGPDEPLLDPISENGEIVRVHLRPYLASGGSVDKLLEAFVHTANDFVGKIDTLETNWDNAIRNGFWPAPVMEEFITAMKAQGYPAVHHSDHFRKSYKPAYRVVLQKYLS